MRSPYDSKPNKAGCVGVTGGTPLEHIFLSSLTTKCGEAETRVRIERKFPNRGTRGLVSLLSISWPYSIRTIASSPIIRIFGRDNYYVSTYAKYWH